MESVNSKYDVLFRVRVLHHYYLDVGKQTAGNITFDLFDNLSAAQKVIQLEKYDASNWVTVLPNKTTAKLLRDRDCIFRIMPDGFAVFTKVINKKPKKSIDQTSFIFDLFFSDEGASVSALPIVRNNGNQSGIYLFSNEIAALNGNTNSSLCHAPPDYDNSRKYTAGEIVAAGGNHYLSLDKINNLNKPVTNVNFWREIDKTIQFATTSNLVERPSLPGNATAGETLKFADVSSPPFAFGRIEISANNSTPIGFRVLNGSKQVQQKSFDIRINRL